MKVGKTLQTLLSFFIAFAMVFPGAVKVEAIDSYPVDQNSIVLEADFTGDSTNDHTYAKAIWTYGDYVYLLVDSTHDLKEITLRSGGAFITSNTPIVHGYTVIVGGTTYNADESQGNVKDSHLTVFKFSLSDILSTLKLNEGGTYTIDVISEQGKGHWIIGGTLTIRIPKAEVKVSKTWQDGPKDDVSIQLYRKLKNAADSSFVAFGDPFTLTSTNPTKTISNLNFTDNIGRIYTYTAKEVNIGEGYKSEVDVTGPTLVGRVQVFTIAIKNTYTPPMMDINVTKVWKDGNDPSARPASLTYYLYEKDGTEPVRTGTAYSPNWNYTFKDLPKTLMDGTAITYEIKEIDVNGYKSTVDGFTVTNLRTGTTRVDGTKFWFDETGSSMRPEFITVILLRNGKEFDRKVVKENTEGLWKYSFTELPEFDDGGSAYTYTIDEVAVTGYEKTPDGYNLKNTRIGEINIPVEKIWLDNGERTIDEITVKLYKKVSSQISMALESEVTKELVKTLVLDSENEWRDTFKNLPEFDEKGYPIEYFVEEIPVEGYTSRIKENKDRSITITNLRTGEIDIPVEKIWLDNGERAVEEITVNLYKKVVPQLMLAMDTQEVTPVEESKEFVKALVLNAENQWKGAFEDLDEFDSNGYPIEYIVEEEAVEGYTSSKLMNEDGSFTFTNLRTGLVDIEGEKTWFDEDEESRPDFITVLLMRNGAEVDRVDVPEEEGLWTFSFEDLDEFDDEGIAYLYEIEELPVEGYNTFILGFDIQNVRTGIVDIEGEKTWDDLMRRPESITINLLQNEVEIDEVTITKDSEGKWKYSFTELPEFDEEGISYKYSVTEDALAGYKATVTGYNIINRQLRGTLHIMKIDDFNDPVKDVVFEIDDTNGVLIYRGSTDEDGILKVTLPLGTYIVRETSAPEDYIMDDKEKTIIIDEDGEIVTLSVVNTLKRELPDTGGKPKPVLPKTGAESSFIFYGIGAMLTLAGFTLLKKKKTSI